MGDVVRNKLFSYHLPVCVSVVVVVVVGGRGGGRECHIKALSTIGIPTLLTEVFEHSPRSICVSF